MPFPRIHAAQWSGQVGWLAARLSEAAHQVQVYLCTSIPPFWTHPAIHQPLMMGQCTHPSIHRGCTTPSGRQRNKTGLSQLHQLISWPSIFFCLPSLPIIPRTGQAGHLISKSRRKTRKGACQQPRSQTSTLHMPTDTHTHLLPPTLSLPHMTHDTHTQTHPHVLSR